MSLPYFDLKQLVEAGIHYGHKTQGWNPLMGPYIFGARGGIHILDLEKTMPLLQKALEVIRQIASEGGRILFVGTKPQASEPIKLAAERCGQYYVNHRWLGGMLTNWKTVSQSIHRLKDIEATLENPQLMTKKEILKLGHQKEKMDQVLCGVREMGGTPDLLFVIDTNREAIAIREANRLKIPVIAIVDSNSDPRAITHIIPGNDDAIRSIDLYCRLMADAVLDGLQAGLKAAGVDLGASTEVPADLADQQSLQNMKDKRKGKGAPNARKAPQKA